MAAVPRVAPEADTSQRSGPDSSASDVRPGTRVLLTAFSVLTLLAVLALLVFPERARESFAWSIAMEVTAAWLGAAYAAGSALSLLALRRRRWDEIRVAVVTVGVFTALTLVATLVHAHRLQLLHGDETGQFAAWVWFAVYLVVPVACGAVVVLQEVGRRPARDVGRPMPRWLARLLLAQGAVLTTAGAVLFLGGLTVHHAAEAVTRFWPWDLMPLSSQVIGAWLISLGVGAALVIRERDLHRLLVPAVAYTLFGALQLAVLVRYRADVDPGDPWLWGYVAVCVVVTLTGGYGTWAARRRLRRTARRVRRTGAGQEGAGRGDSRRGTTQTSSRYTSSTASTDARHRATAARPAGVSFARTWASASARSSQARTNSAPSWPRTSSTAAVMVAPGSDRSAVD